jgi:hypothetical protein
MMEGKGQSIRENSGNRDQARPGEGRASQVNACTVRTKQPGRGQKEAWRWTEMALGMVLGMVLGMACACACGLIAAGAGQGPLRL